MKATTRAIALVTLCFFSCDKKLHEKEYVQWVRDYANGLHVKREAGDYVFDLQYMPIDYLKIQNREMVRQSDAGIQYYALTIEPKLHNADLVNFNVSNEAEKQRKLYYLSYTFQQDIEIEEGGKTSPCVMYHFERPVDMKTSRTFLLGFDESADKENDDRESKVVIKSPLFGSLPVKIKISKDKIPGLVL